MAFLSSSSVSIAPSRCDLNRLGVSHHPRRPIGIVLSGARRFDRSFLVIAGFIGVLFIPLSPPVGSDWLSRAAIRLHRFRGRRGFMRYLSGQILRADAADRRDMILIVALVSVPWTWITPTTDGLLLILGEAFCRGFTTMIQVLPTVPLYTSMPGGRVGVHNARATALWVLYSFRRYQRQHVMISAAIMVTNG